VKEIDTRGKIINSIDVLENEKCLLILGSGRRLAYASVHITAS